MINFNLYLASMKRRIVTYFFACAVVLGCTSAPRFHSETAQENANKTSQTESSDYRDLNTLETVVGIASYYADDFHNKITYSGEVYDMNGLSAAHPSYPMGTIVRITNLTNGKSVVLKINDRMPYREDRIIDLSLGAAKELGMKKAGIERVKLEVLKWGEGRK